MFTRGYILRICQSYPSSAIPSDHVIWDPPKTFTTIPVRSQWGRDQLYPDHDSIVSVDYLSIFHYKYTYIYIFGDIIYIWRFPKMRVPPNHPMQSDCPEHILNPETIQLGTPIYGSSASAPFTLMWSCASTSWLREQCRRANAAANGCWDWPDHSSKDRYYPITSQVCPYCCWLLVVYHGIPTPLKNDGVRQIGSSSQLLGKIKTMFQTTNQVRIPYIFL